ncbi:hypothetical protein [Streptomyces sp. enrichment culture]|uniref:hypothetical protein n=1 Tax=Streptomyces sp. enrichment culture TaxID=1795815 RepID=UPI003F565DE1
MVKAARARKSTAAPPEIVWCGDTLEGYSFVVFGKYRGRSRRYWWWCCGCWEHCQDSPVRELEDAQEDYRLHGVLCPGQVTVAAVVVRPAAA